MLPSLIFILPPTHAVDILHVEKATLEEGQASWRAAWAAYSVSQWAEAASNKAAANPEEAAPFSKALLGASARLPASGAETSQAIGAGVRQSPHP